MGGNHKIIQESALYEEIYGILNKPPKERSVEDLKRLMGLPVSFLNETTNPFAQLFARYLEFSQVKTGKLLFGQKSRKNAVYWVIEGSLGVQNKANSIVRAYKNLDHFFQLQLIEEFDDFEEVKALEDTKMGVISDRIMIDIIEPLKRDKNWELQDFLSCTPLLMYWSQYQIRSLAQSFQLITFGKQSYVFQEKQPSTGVFFIKKGAFEIRKNFSGAIDYEEQVKKEGIVVKDLPVSKFQKLQTKEFKLKGLSVGDYFGEEDVLTGGVRYYSVMCTSLQGEIAMINAKDYEEQIYSQIMTRQSIEQHMKKKSALFRKRQGGLTESLEVFGKYLVNEHFHKDFDEIVAEIAIHPNIKGISQQDRDINCREMQAKSQAQHISNRMLSQEAQSIRSSNNGNFQQNKRNISAGPGRKQLEYASNERTKTMAAELLCIEDIEPERDSVKQKYFSQTSLQTTSRKIRSKNNIKNQENENVMEGTTNTGQIAKINYFEFNATASESEESPRQQYPGSLSHIPEFDEPEHPVKFSSKDSFKISSLGSTATSKKGRSLVLGSQSTEPNTAKMRQIMSQVDDKFGKYHQNLVTQCSSFFNSNENLTQTQQIQPFEVVNNPPQSNKRSEQKNIITQTSDQQKKISNKEEKKIASLEQSPNSSNSEDDNNNNQDDNDENENILIDGQSPLNFLQASSNLMKLSQHALTNYSTQETITPQKTLTSMGGHPQSGIRRSFVTAEYSKKMPRRSLNLCASKSPLPKSFMPTTTKYLKSEQNQQGYEQQSDKHEYLGLNATQIPSSLKQLKANSTKVSQKLLQERYQKLQSFSQQNKISMEINQLENKSSQMNGNNGNIDKQTDNSIADDNGNSIRRLSTRNGGEISKRFYSSSQVNHIPEKEQPQKIQKILSNKQIRIPSPPKQQENIFLSSPQTHLMKILSKRESVKQTGSHKFLWQVNSSVEKDNNNSNNINGNINNNAYYQFSMKTQMDVKVNKPKEAIQQRSSSQSQQQEIDPISRLSQPKKKKSLLFVPGAQSQNTFFDIPSVIQQGAYRGSQRYVRHLIQ